MTVRFLIDEDVDPALVTALRTREPRIDVLDVKEQGLRSLPDEALLQIAHEQGRVLVSHDRQTMTKDFYARMEAGRGSAGLVIILRRAKLGNVIDVLLLIWGASTAEECQNLVTYLS